MQNRKNYDNDDSILGFDSAILDNVSMSDGSRVPSFKFAFR